MFSRTKIILLAALALTAAACGLKGPLYQPDEPNEAVPPATEPTDATKKKEPASGAAPGEQSEPSVAPLDPDRPVVPPGRR
jgi:predicted small lipoprotein YifL